MAHGAEIRARAEDLYVRRGWSFNRIARETGISKTTLLKWAARHGWKESRSLREQLHRKTMQLAVRLAHAAAQSTDPQQAYAAAQAAELAGLGREPTPRAPSPARIAEALFDVMARHPEVGPVVRRHRRVLIAEALREVERLEQRAAGAVGES